MIEIEETLKKIVIEEAETALPIRERNANNDNKLTLALEGCVLSEDEFQRLRRKKALYSELRDCIPRTQTFFNVDELQFVKGRKQRGPRIDGCLQVPNSSHTLK